MASNSTTSPLPCCPTFSPLPCCPTFSLLTFSRHPTSSTTSTIHPTRLRAAASFAHRTACTAHAGVVPPPPSPVPSSSYEARHALLAWLDASAAEMETASVGERGEEDGSRRGEDEEEGLVERRMSEEGMSCWGPRYGRLRVMNPGPGDEMYEEEREREQNGENQGTRQNGENRGKQRAQDSDSEDEDEQTRRLLLEATRAAQRRLRRHYRNQGWGMLEKERCWVVDEVRWYHHLEGRTDAVARYEERVWREYEEKRGLRGARKDRTGLGLDWGM